MRPRFAAHYTLAITSMAVADSWRILSLGVVVLIARLLTFPRAPWDSDELRFPFAIVVAIGIAASVVTAVAFAIAFADPLAALLFSFSAAVLVHAGAARLDALAWMFVALALLYLDKPLLFGAFAGAAVACWPEALISGLALLFAALILVIGDRRGRIAAAAAFAVVALPFIAAPENIPTVTGWNVVRFTLHPWGSKFVSLPILLCALAGIRPLMRNWNVRVEVLMWFALVHVATGIAMASPSDGVRWAVPALMFTSLLASAGLRAFRVQRIGAAAVCALSVWYTFPILRDRVTRPSPLIQALRAIPEDAVPLHDRETAFAGGLPLDVGMRRYLDRPDVPLLHVVAGNSNERGARVFSRDDLDPYGKLTRNAFRQISLEPVPIGRRFAPIRGVYGEQRNEAGQSWRWLQGEAEIRLPGSGGVVHLALGLPPDAPVEVNEVRVNETLVRVRRGETVEVQLAPATHLLVHTSRTFRLAPPDTREAAVQLLRVGQ